MFIDLPERNGGEPLFCKGCDRPIIGEDREGYHPACWGPFTSLQRAMDMLSRGWP